MKNWKKTALPFLGGVLCTLMLMTLTVPSLAAGGLKSISVTTGTNVYVDDVKIYPTDANGTPVDVFVYNGTTYLPIRAISQALGKNIAWDGPTNSVFVGEHAPDHLPAVKLSDLDIFAKTTGGEGQKFKKDNIGVSRDSMFYYNGLSSNSEVEYRITGRYSKFTGVYFLPASSVGESYTYSLSIYGDERLLWDGTVTDGVEPLPINIDLTGVQKLKFKFVSSNHYSHYQYIGDTMFFT